MSNPSAIALINARIRPYMVWALRIIVGATFMFAGLVKTIDPRGFFLKITEYLNVWGIDWLWRESVATIGVGISIVEFCAGVLLLTGCLRRSICLLMLAFMAVMLPLTAYIYIVNPVADCGCFGDALVISNGATFYKNVLLTLGLIYLAYNNKKVVGVYSHLVQWMVMVASLFYCLALALIGITIQPVVDFRPFKVGTMLVGDNDGPTVLLTYERDGVTSEFDADHLPDSTWTYVGRRTVEPGTSNSIAVFDEDLDVTADVISDSGKQVLLVIPDPKLHNKSRASMANNINDYVNKVGGSMIGIIGTDEAGLAEWEKIARPHFDVYTSDDTMLKSLVRGDAGIVYLVDGKIMWKRNLYSLSGDFPDFTAKDNQLDTVTVVDSGHLFKLITLIYVGALFIIFLLGLIHVRKPRKR